MHNEYSAENIVAKR